MASQLDEIEEEDKVNAVWKVEVVHIKYWRKRLKKEAKSKEYGHV